MAENSTLGNVGLIWTMDLSKKGSFVVNENQANPFPHTNIFQSQSEAQKAISRLLLARKIANKPEDVFDVYGLLRTI